jgi:type II restriction/modification system DNA methylase subunit YeeA
METAQLKKFAQNARRLLLEQVSSKLGFVLKSESATRRESPKAVNQLEEALSALGKEALIDKVAYIWFNRFSALRFMDVNGYNRVSVVSPTAGQIQPEILAEAKAGHIDDSLVDAQATERVLGLLNGSIKSPDGQAEAFRQLIVSVCNSYHSLMPYLFQRIDDYTELLMPDDLLSENSVLALTREAMTAESCESVEVIGWLYQFYISEKKDKVFEDLKKNKKVTPENIPAATQLFTPHWIVRYLVENSLGRLWMLNNPSSRIVEKMDYYIKPEEVETDFLKISSPEELKICDPACGSGHMLTYAYDLLYAIYLDTGYDPVDIPELILTKNLYGVEIDERAAELAAFALSMKAMKGNPEDDTNNRRRFFRNPIKPNICKLEKITFTDEELNEYFEFVGKDLFTAELRESLKDFEEADNFGSLIRPTISDVTEILRTLEAKDVSGQLFLTDTHHKVLQVLRQADYLSQKYHVVIANPPYMGGKGMNPRMAKWLKNNFADVKSDLFAAFIVRLSTLAVAKAELGVLAPFVWMFIATYEKLREYLLSRMTITSLVQLEYNAFAPAMIPVAAFTVTNSYKPYASGGFIRLSDFKGHENQAPRTLEAIQNPDCGWFFRTSAADFSKIPGSPIAYWLSVNVYEIFSSLRSSRELFFSKKGTFTGDNARFLRLWWEVSHQQIGFYISSREESISSLKKWFPYNKGGEFKKWYGNIEFVVNWENDGDELQNFKNENGDLRSGIRNPNYYFREGISWSDITSGKTSFRYYPSGFISDSTGPTAYFREQNINEELEYLKYCAYFNNAFIPSIAKILNPTLHFTSNDFSNLPVIDDLPSFVDDNISDIFTSAKNDWDSNETSWDFTNLELLSHKECQLSLNSSYENLRRSWREMTLEMQQLEEESNRIFIDAYELQEELSPEVPLNEITLTCNPHYRYGGDRTEEELESLLLTDTMRELISYAVGCMLGRYSLDTPGLILANQGEALADYIAQIPEPTFMPDDDNVIPMIDFEGDWFEDDIAERFKQFLRVTFGDEHFVENLAFIEESIGKDIRKFFLKDFYNDHIKRYKKRPIYWLFSSPKGTFNALIYMHRYRADTVSVVLNDYLREFRTKLEARKDSYEQITISASASQKEKTQALKMIDKIDKAIDEVNEYEREVLYPLATQNIEIDLDDGVKHNYPLFGNALKKITGL